VAEPVEEDRLRGGMVEAHLGPESSLASLRPAAPIVGEKGTLGPSADSLRSLRTSESASTVGSQDIAELNALKRRGKRPIC